MQYGVNMRCYLRDGSIFRCAGSPSGEAVGWRWLSSALSLLWCSILWVMVLFSLKATLLCDSRTLKSRTMVEWLAAGRAKAILTWSHRCYRGLDVSSRGSGFITLPVSFRLLFPQLSDFSFQLVLHLLHTYLCFSLLCPSHTPYAQGNYYNHWMALRLSCGSFKVHRKPDPFGHRGAHTAAQEITVPR